MYKRKKRMTPKKVVGIVIATMVALVISAGVIWVAAWVINSV